MRQSGSTLITVVIALAAIGGLGAYLMKGNEESFSKAKSQAIDRDADDLSAMVQRILSHRGTCTATMLNLNAANSPVSEIKNTAGDPVIDSSIVFGQTGLKIDNLALRDYPDSPGVDDGVNTLPNGMSSTNLLLTFKEIPKSPYEKRKLQRRVKLIVSQNASKITSCFAVSSGIDTIWKKEAGTENIFYDLGDVGVGTKNPQQKLHVSGNIRVENASGEGMVLGGNPAEYSFDLATNRPLNVVNSVGALRDARMRNATGIETIQLSGAPSSCTALTEKSIRYHKPSRTLQVCLGNFWRTLESNPLILFPLPY